MWLWVWQLAHAQSSSLIWTQATSNFTGDFIQCEWVKSNLLCIWWHLEMITVGKTTLNNFFFHRKRVVHENDAPVNKYTFQRFLFCYIFFCLGMFCHLSLKIVSNDFFFFFHSQPNWLGPGTALWGNHSFSGIYQTRNGEWTGHCQKLRDCVTKQENTKKQLIAELKDQKHARAKETHCITSLILFWNLYTWYIRHS